MSLFHVTIAARQVGLEYRHGALTRVLAAGRHRKRFGARVTRVDLRESLLQVSPQEILTTEGIGVRVSAVVRWSVAEPVAFVERTTDPLGTVYLAAQVALREALAGRTVEELGGRRAVLDETALTGAVAGVAQTVGVQVHEVVVKDIIVPADLRHAATEVVTARSRGAAQLEAARAETAALRSLANGAKLLDAHPALAQLRLVQAAPLGSQLVLHVGEPADRT
jgi:regulator of protease activity HflC (stomatin/prohibitin superfamily)